VHRFLRQYALGEPECEVANTMPSVPAARAS